jgi:hypothetical protein
MAMIHGALEFYLNNKTNYNLISNEKNLTKPTNKKTNSKKLKLPSWLNMSNIRAESKEHLLRNQSFKLKEELIQKEKNWKQIIKGETEFGDSSTFRKVKRMNVGETRNKMQNYVKIKKHIDFKGEDNHQLKIIYASRTHSQIKEFMKELKTVCKFNNLNLKVVHLGSRQLFCMNENINHKTKSNFFHEMCQNQRDHKKCEFYNFTKIFNIPPIMMVTIINL